MFLVLCCTPLLADSQKTQTWVVTYVMHLLNFILYDRSNVSVGRFNHLNWGEGNTI